MEVPELRHDSYDVRSVERSADLRQPDEAHDEADRDGAGEVKLLYTSFVLFITAAVLGAYLAYTVYREIDSEPELQPLLGVVRAQHGFPRVLR